MTGKKKWNWRPAYYSKLNYCSIHYLCCILRMRTHTHTHTHTINFFVPEEECFNQLSSVQFSRSAVSDSLRPHGLQHARPPYPSPTRGACSNSCPSSWWCHSAISSSAIPFSSCLQSFLASESFLRSQFFASGDQSTGVSASTSVLPMNNSGLISFRMDWLDLLAVQEDSQEFSPTPQFKSINSSAFSFLYSPTLTSIHEHWKKP